MTIPTPNDLLSSLGVYVEPAFEYAEHRGDWLIVGLVIVEDSGDVRAIPHRGLTPEQHERFTSVASTVWAMGRAAVMGGWTYSPRLGWVTSVAFRIRDDNVSSAAVAEERVAA